MADLEAETATGSKPPKKKKAPKKKRPLWVRIVRGFAITGLSLVLLVALVVGGVTFYLTTNAGKERVRALIEKRVQAKVNGTVKLEAVDYELLGPIELKGLSISDEDGKQVVVLDHVMVAPDWKVLASRKSIAIDEVALEGLHLSIVKDADGNSNLKKLIKTQDEPEGEKKPLDKVIEVRKISIKDVDVSIASADGTELAIEDLAVEGSIRAQPSSKDVAITLKPLGLNLFLKKPEDKGGLKLGLKGVKTGVQVDLAGGKGKAKLDPLTADLSLTVPGKIDKTFPIGWDAIELDLGDDDIGLSLEKLALGAVSLASIDVKSHVADGKPTGDQDIDVIGLKVDAAQVNSLLGKEMLKSNVDIEAHLAGTAEQPKIDLDVKTSGGKVKIAASLDLKDAADPKHDVVVTLTDVDTDALLSSALNVPPVKVASLEVRAKGNGKDPALIGTKAQILATNVVAKGVTVDKIDAKLAVNGPKITIDSVDVDAVEQHVSARGTFNRETKDIDLTVNVEGDVGVALAKLKEAGLPITANVPAGLIKLPKGDLTVIAKGTVGGNIDVNAKAEKLTLLGGKAKLAVNAALIKGEPEKGEKAVKLKGFDFDISLDGILLSSILALRGKAIPRELGFDAVLALHAKGKGTITDPLVDLTLTATTLRKDKGDTVTAFVSGHVTREAATVNLVTRDSKNAADVLLKGNALLPLMLEGEKKGIDPAKWLDIHLELARRDLSRITNYVPPLLLAGKPLPKFGQAELALDVTGSLSRPKAKVHVYVGASLLEPEQPAPMQELALDATLEPGDATSPGFKLAADLGVHLEQKANAILSGHIGATFPYSPLAGGADHVKYEGHLDFGPGLLSTLPDTPKLAKARSIGGSVKGSLDFSGNRNDVAAQLKVDAEHIDLPVEMSGLIGRPVLLGDPKGMIDAQIRVDVKPATTTVLVDSQLGATPLAKIAGSLGLAGTGLIPRAKQGLDPALDLELTIPRRKVETLGSLRALFLKVPGFLDGDIKVSGTAKNPLAAGGIKISEVAMMDGNQGGLGIDLLLDASHLEANVGVGTSVTKDAPVLVTVKVPREELFGFSKGSELPIEARFAAKSADIRRLIPKDTFRDSKLEPKGTLDWDMVAKVRLKKKDDKNAIEEGSVDGLLALKGDVPIPGTKRMYKNVNVGIRAAGSEVTIDGIRLEEADADVKDRWFNLTGSLVLDKLRPKKVDVSLKSNKWLLFGTNQIGRPDAPRGILTIDAKAHAELDRPTKLATIDVDHLDVQFPDRFDKAHQPEDLHLGDVVFISKESDVGKLPVPESVLKAKAEAEERARLAASPAPVEPTAAEDGGLDIDVHIAPGARLFQSPIDLTTGGSLSIAVRPKQETKIRGKLVMSKGELSLGGKFHPLREGSLTFDEEHPKGYIDLWFEKKLPPWTLRNVSEASAGESLTVHTFGPLSDRKNVLAGAGSPGALYDLLSMHNVGREQFYSEADLPGSVSAQFPQRGGLLALSFISVNLPHLLFMDKVAAWSDPYDDHRSYGHLEHYEAERYFANGDGRIRAAKRPSGVGRSEAELEVDYLFFNNARTLFGVGATGGSRGGGGPGLVFEWSSKN